VCVAEPAAAGGEVRAEEDESGQQQSDRGVRRREEEPGELSGEPELADREDGGSTDAQRDTDERDGPDGRVPSNVAEAVGEGRVGVTRSSRPGAARFAPTCATATKVATTSSPSVPCS